jgi:hypothetical protein
MFSDDQFRRVLTCLAASNRGQHPRLVPFNAPGVASARRALSSKPAEDGRELERRVRSLGGEVIGGEALSLPEVDFGHL